MEKLLKLMWEVFEVDVTGNSEEFEYDVDVFFRQFSIHPYYQPTLYAFFNVLRSLVNEEEEKRNEKIETVMGIFQEEIKLLRSLVELAE